MPPTIPPISSVPALPTEDRAKILDTLFEPCVQLHTLSISLLHDTVFPSYNALIDAIGEQLNQLSTSQLASDREWLDAILSAHPRLGEKKVDSEQSRAEQAQLKAGPEGEAEKLAKLNAEYEATFPGLRYVVFVNGRGRPAIMEDMERRIQRGDLKQEKTDAIKAMCDIACDRAKKLGG